MDTLEKIGTIQDAQLFANGPSEESYDDVPYGSHPISSSHPDKLFNVAKLYGLSPVPPENARILELGCAGGGNLIPIASQFPGAQCVGIDLSEVQCANARTAINYSRLKNIEIIQGSIADIGQKQGKFDYIICHGVYSWVPDFVRPEILRVASENLSENGVAFVSYNALPGWYFRGMIRGMILQHTADVKDSRTKILQSRALLDFLMLSTQHQSTPHASFIRAEATLMNRLPDEYLFHEHLEGNNQAFFFRDFVKDANKFGLQYLGESELSSSWLGNYSEPAIQKLSKIDDAVLLSHYLDCISGRTFRETLLVHETAKINRQVNADRLSGVRFTGYFKPASENATTVVPSGTPVAGSEKRFTTLDDKFLATSDPFLIKILESISNSYPCSISIDEMLAEIQTKSPLENVLPDNFNRENLTTELFLWTMKGILKFQFHSDRMSAKTITAPRVTDWFLSQAQAGTHATSLKHQIIELSELQRCLIPMMDGKNRAEDFIKHTEFLIKSNLIKVEPQYENKKLTPQFVTQWTIAELTNLAARCAFLPES